MHATCYTHLILNSSLEQYLVRSKNHAVPLYAISSSLLLLPPLRFKYLPQLHPIIKTFSLYSSLNVTEKVSCPHKQQAKLELCVF